MRENGGSEITIVCATERHTDDLEALVARIEAEHRRQAIGNRATADLVREHGFVGIHLLTRPDSHADRALCQFLGRQVSRALLDQLRVERHDSSF